MIRVLTIFAAVAALAVSTAPASAGTSNTKNEVAVESFSLDIGGSEKARRPYVANHTEGTVSVVGKTAPKILNQDSEI